MGKIKYKSVKHGARAKDKEQTLNKRSVEIGRKVESSSSEKEIEMRGYIMWH